MLNPTLAFDADPFSSTPIRRGLPFTTSPVTEKEPTMTYAFDAAVRAATARGTDRAFRAMNDLREAEREVQPVLGTVPAMDSAADVYRAALDRMGVDLAGVEPHAYAGLFRALRKSNPGKLREAARAPAMDAAARRGFDARFPNSGRLHSGLR